MRLPNSLERAPVTGALFYFLVCLFLLTPAKADAGTTACHTDHTDEAVRIRYVHDGDTLWLEDGRKVRVIGINAPELAREEQPAEPFAEQARNDLRQLLGQSNTVRLRYGKEKTDRYGRLLTHVFLNDGRNISEWLLHQGLAFSLTVPPNLWQLDCYLRAEQLARDQNRGLWAKKHFRLLDADKLPDDTRGFQIIRGKIQRIGHSRGTVWLNFNRRFAVRILRTDLSWFAGLDIEKLKGKQLEVRGWVQYHKRQLRMRIRHPAAIRILP